jgi:PAS domain S-box-containing protein
MRIKTRLRVNVAVTLGLLLLLTAVLIWSAGITTVAEANVDLAERMQKTVAGRILVRDEYLIAFSERARIQWEAETETFQSLLAQAKVQLPVADQSMLDGIESDFAATVSIFHQIVEIRQTQISAGADSLPSTEGEQRLVSQLLLRAYSLHDRIHALADTTQTDDDAARTLLTWLSFSFMVMTMVATLVNSTLIQRLLTRRIEQLREGMEMIGSGRLDHRILVAGNDELSDLARASNAMAARLMETTTSVVNLQREVDERKRAQEKLREALEELEITLHSIGDAVISTDLEGRVRQMNPVAEQLTGWTEAEAQGRPLEDVFHIVQEETRTPVENPVQRVLHERLIVGLANHSLLIGRTGVEYPIADSGAPIRDEDHVTVGVVLVFRDQTRERAAEKELRGLMERQQAILAAVPDIIMEVDRDKVYTWANQTGQEFFGDDVIGHEATEYFAGEEDVYGTVQPLFNGSSPMVYVESWQRRKDGQVRLLAWWCRSLADDRGNVTGALSSATDITERKRGENALRQSEAKFRELTDRLPEVIYEFNLEGRFTYVNQPGLSFFGYSQEDIDRGISIWQVVTPEDLERAKANIQSLISGGNIPYGIEYTILRKDSSRVPMAIYSAPILQEGRPIGVRGFLIDISERKRLEQEIEKARTEFLFAVSHELKTPIFVMNASLEMLQNTRPAEREKRTEEFSETWKRNLHRLQHLINNLVDSQRSATTGFKLELQLTDMKELVEQVIGEQELLARPKGVQVLLASEPLPPLSVDPEAMHRLVENLVNNAIKYSPMNGEIAIGLAKTDERATLTVHDQGPGISALEQMELFQPFHRAASAVRAVVPGTGLGLYVCKMIAEAHGGEISLASEPGEGMTVTVCLPLR